MDVTSKSMFERSSEFETSSRLVAFLYELMRDHVTPGILENIMRSTDGEATGYRLSNGYLAMYAEDLMRRLR
jgi:hypothetical protein